MSNINVSIQAFFEQIQSWSMTLARQSKKMKNVKPAIKNKFKINSIQIVLTEIQSQLIKYKKIRYKYQANLQSQNLVPNFQTEYQKVLSDDILMQYSSLSKSFMSILEKISLIEEQNNQANFMIQNEEQNLDKKTNKPSLAKNKERTLFNQTFTYKVSKQTKAKGNKSLFQKRKGERPKQQSQINDQIRQKAQSTVFNHNDSSNLSLLKPRKFVGNKPALNVVSSDQDTNLWQIRHQLTQIKMMMKEMKNQIKFHQHQQTNKEISKIESKNRKLASELKSMKEQNRFIFQKIQDIKNQLAYQKKQQVDLINRFERRSSSIINYTGVKDSRATNGQNYRSLGDEKYPMESQTNQQKSHNVSDWVKKRI